MIDKNKTEAEVQNGVAAEVQNGVAAPLISGNEFQSTYRAEMRAATLQHQAAEAGVIFYELPHQLREEQVDPLLRKAVFGINRSGWLWTAESCQGHPDSEEYEPWANNTRPMLRLVCEKVNTGRLFACLLEAAQTKERGYLESTGFEVWPHVGERKRDWVEVLIYIPANNVYARNIGIAVFERLAEIAQRPID